jgi:hypothetical protein
MNHAEATELKVLLGGLAIRVIASVQAGAAELSDYDKERGLSRSPDGKWASNKTSSSTEATPPSSMGDMLELKDIEESISKVNKLDTDEKLGFINGCLKTDSGLDAIASTLKGAAKKGWDEAQKLLDKVRDINLERSWQAFNNGTQRLIKNIGETDLSQFLLGMAAFGIATWGVMSLVSGVGATIALPGIIGVALESGELGLIGKQLLKIASDAAWAFLKIGVLLPHLGLNMIANSLDKNPLPVNPTEAINTPEAIKELDPDSINSSEILKLYDVDQKEVESKINALETESKKEYDSGERNIKALAHILTLKDHLKKVEAIYRDYLEGKTKRRKAFDLRRLNKEIQSTKDDMKEAQSILDDMKLSKG